MVFLHGCPSDSEEFLSKFPAFIYMQYQVFAVDLPGYGASTGKCQPSRSENVLDEGGPADTIKFVIRSLQLGTPVLYGYDWGGCIAMKMGIQNSKGFSKIIALHPSYNETEKDELKKLKTPTMLQWVKQDQLHPWG